MEAGQYTEIEEEDNELLITLHASSSGASRAKAIQGRFTPSCDVGKEKVHFQFVNAGVVLSRLRQLRINLREQQENVPLMQQSRVLRRPSMQRISLEMLKLRLSRLYEKEHQERQPTRQVVVQENIKLNVGGTRFEISKAHLLKHKDTYFTALLLNDVWSCGKDGTFDIDVNPKAFQHVVLFLQTDQLDFEAMTAPMAYYVLSTLDYLSMKILAWIPPNTSKDEVPIKFYEENQCFLTANNLSRCIEIRGKFPSFRYAVKILELPCLCMECFQVPYWETYYNPVLYLGFRSKNKKTGHIIDFALDGLTVGDVISVCYSQSLKTIQFMKNGIDIVPPPYARSRVWWSIGLLYPAVKTNIPGLKLTLL